MPVSVQPSDAFKLVKLDANKPPDAVISQPVVACILTKNAKPLEAEVFDLTTIKDCTKLAGMTESVYMDNLSMIVWPCGGQSSLDPAYDLLRRMRARSNTAVFPESFFATAWIKEAVELLIDYRGISELLAFKEPVILEETDDDL